MTVFYVYTVTINFDQFILGKLKYEFIFLLFFYLLYCSAYGLVLCCFYNLSYLKFDRHDHCELYVKDLHEHSSRILPLISTKEKNAYRFGMT